LAVLGIKVSQTRLIAMFLGGFMIGIAGGLYDFYLGFIDQEFLNISLALIHYVILLIDEFGRAWGAILAAVAVFFNELLDSPLADLKLLSDQLSVHVMINNPPTYPGNILLVKLHFRWPIIGEITSAKFLADTTK